MASSSGSIEHCKLLHRHATCPVCRQRLQEEEEEEEGADDGVNNEDYGGGAEEQSGGFDEID